jgi:hypothetical protein
MTIKYIRAARKIKITNKAIYIMQKNLLLSLFFIAGITITNAQSATNPMFENLPIGKYTVGFKIVTLTDDSRIDKPAYNYFGEKTTGDRSHSFSVHIWYPAKPNTGKGIVTYGEYCYNMKFKRTDESIDPQKKEEELRRSGRGFFTISDNDFKKMTPLPMMAQKNAIAANGKFPLLIGSLRPVSTAVTIEFLVSHGYVVVMVVPFENVDYPKAFINEIADMKLAMKYLSKTGMTDDNQIGAFGFSGSAFPPFLLSMDDLRIRAYADLEGAFFQGFFEQFSTSDFYNTRNLKIPFLHLFGKEHSTEEKYFNEFEKMKFSDRYRVLFNQPQLNHWDFASEGRATTNILHNRGETEKGIQATYELANLYLLHFFNMTLKNSEASRLLMENKKNFPGYAESLWSITKYDAIKPSPNTETFNEILNRKGVNEAITVAKETAKTDPDADFLKWFELDEVGNKLHSKNKLADELTFRKFTVVQCPNTGTLWRKLSDLYAAPDQLQERIYSLATSLVFEPYPIGFYNLGCFYSISNNKDKAFEALNKAIAYGFNSKRQFENDTDLTSLKSDERWKALVEKLK